MNDAPDDGTPLVKVQIQIGAREAHDRSREVIKKVTKGHEVVDVDGFVFKRKRKAAVLEELQPAQQQQQQHQEQQQQQQQQQPLPEASAAQPSVFVTPVAANNPQQVIGVTPPRSTAPAAKAAAKAAAQALAVAELEAELQQQRRRDRELAAQQLQLDAQVPFVIDREQLAHIVQHLLATKLQAQLGQTDGAAAAVQRIGQLFAAGLRRSASAAAGGALAECLDDAEPVPGAAAAVAAAPFAGRALLPLVHAAKLKASLQRRLQGLQAEEQEWRRLEEKYRQLQRDLEAGAARATAAGLIDPSSATAAGTGIGQAPGGPLQEGTDESATMDASAVAAAQLAGQGKLVKACKDTYQTLAIQVEALCSMLERTEYLAARADQACSTLQAEYHHDKFRMFPHVESPAWLIKQITRKRQLVVQERDADAMKDTA